MRQENFYEIIFQRKSIRKYDLTPLDENTLKQISSKINNLKPFYDPIKTELKIVSQNDVKGLLAVKAPHYIIAYSEAKEGYLTNIGFMLQQIDLFLSANGIGSCWLGLAKPIKEVSNFSNLEFVIVLAFGKPAEPLHRSSASEFKRKSLQQIRTIEDKDQLLEPVRLAPSATNSQPWYFTGEAENLHVYCVKLNFIKAMIYEKMNKVDIGIAMCHLWIAAKHFGRTVEFINDQYAQNNSPAGYYYITTAKIK